MNCMVWEHSAQLQSAQQMGESPLFSSLGFLTLEKEGAPESCKLQGLSGTVCCSLPYTYGACGLLTHPVEWMWEPSF